MRKLIVIVMALLVAAQVLADVRAFGRMNGTYAIRQGIQEYSYVHYLFLVEYVYELIFLKLAISVAIFLFWLRQFIAPVKSLLLRQLTSYYLVCQLIFFYMLMSLIVIILKGHSKISIIDTISLWMNVGGYEHFSWFVPVSVVMLLILVLPIWHSHLALKVERET